MTEAAGRCHNLPQIFVDRNGNLRNLRNFFAVSSGSDNFVPLAGALTDPDFLTTSTSVKEFNTNSFPQCCLQGCLLCDGDCFSSIHQLSNLVYVEEEQIQLVFEKRESSAADVTQMISILIFLEPSHLHIWKQFSSLLNLAVPSLLC